ncbi:MAG TPA: hypothetical protein ENI27_04090 [bacterium]|nr:hypothetical protein [bacterium]
MDIEKFLAVKGYASTTVDQYKRTLTNISRDLGDLENLSPMELRKWLESFGWANATKWVSLCAVRAYLKWRYGESHLAMELKMKREESPPQRSLKMSQVEELLYYFETHKAKGRRDLAICTMFLDTGLRSFEMCHLEMRWTDVRERCIKVRVKGGSIQTGVFCEYTASCVMRWLGDRKEYVRNDARSLFVSVGGTTPGNPLTTGGLRAEVRKWGKESGIGPLSPHDLRRTFATLSTRLGAPSRIVQVAGRWSRLEMVERYTRDIVATDFDPWFPVSAAMELNR